MKRAIEKGNIEGAKIYAQNAIRKKTEQLNYLKARSHGRTHTHAKWRLGRCGTARACVCAWRVRLCCGCLHAHPAHAARQRIATRTQRLGACTHTRTVAHALP